MADPSATVFSESHQLPYLKGDLSLACPLNEPKQDVLWDLTVDPVNDIIRLTFNYRNNCYVDEKTKYDHWCRLHSIQGVWKAPNCYRPPGKGQPTPNKYGMVNCEPGMIWKDPVTYQWDGRLKDLLPGSGTGDDDSKTVWNTFTIFMTCLAAAFAFLSVLLLLILTRGSSLLPSSPEPWIGLSSK